MTLLSARKSNTDLERESILIFSGYRGFKQNKEYQLQRSSETILEPSSEKIDDKVIKHVEEDGVKGLLNFIRMYSL